jgi:hypothetical protein
MNLHTSPTVGVVPDRMSNREIDLSTSLRRFSTWTSFVRLGPTVEIISLFAVLIIKSHKERKIQKNIE